MASSSKAEKARWRAIPVALKVVALCLIALVALLMLLPAPPDKNPGGITTITKRVPPLRDTVDPLAEVVPPVEQMPAPEISPLPSPDVSSASPPQAAPPPAPKIVAAPEPTPAPPSPTRKPTYETPPATRPAPDWSPEVVAPKKPPAQDIARLPAEPEADATAVGKVSLPSKSDIREWLRSQAWEFLGGVDEQGNILYRFEVWLEAPADVLKAIKSVSYAYDAPSATPKSLEMDRAEGGFRARFGSLACSKEVTVIVTMADGRSRRAVADGCQALN